MTLPPEGQDSDLIEPHGFRGSQPIHSYVAKMFSQQSRARLYPGLRNHENKHAFALKPSISMLQKDQFQSFVLPLTVLPIVRRVEIEQGHGFRGAADVQRVGMQNIDPKISSLLGSMCVDLNAIS